MAIRNFPVRDTRHYNFFAPVVRIKREPLSTDIKDPSTGRYYERPTFWQVGRDPSTGTEGDLWYLADITANVADWQKLATSSGAGGTIISLTGDDAAIVFADVDGNIDVQGSTVANATNAKPLYIDGTPASNLIEVELQVGAALASAPTDKNDAGLVSVNSNQLTMTEHGYVGLVGGTDLPPVQTITGDGSTAVGPDANGDITFNASTVANATNAKPLYIDDSVANTITSEIQVGADITGAPADKNDAGLVSFNDTQFVTDTNGYTSLVGGTDLAPVQTLTGDSGGAISPDANGDIDIVGGTGVTVTGSGTQLSIAVDSPSPGPGFVNMTEEFMWSNTLAKTDAILGDLGWRSSRDLVQGTNSSNTHPGVVEVSAGTGVDYSLTLGDMYLGGGETTFTWIIKLDNLGTTAQHYSISIGLVGDTATKDDNGVFFRYQKDINSDKWQIVSADGGTKTTNDSGVAASTSWVKLEAVVNAGATSITYKIDGIETSNSPITTNITSNALQPKVFIENQAGATAYDFEFDFFQLLIDLTTSR